MYFGGGKTLYFCVHLAGEMTAGINFLNPQRTVTGGHNEDLSDGVELDGGLSSTAYFVTRPYCVHSPFAEIKDYLRYF